MILAQISPVAQFVSSDAAVQRPEANGGSGRRYSRPPADGLMRGFSAAGLRVLNEVRAEHGLAPLQSWNDLVIGTRAIYVRPRQSSISEPEANCRSMSTMSDPHSSHSRRTGNP